MRRTIAFFGLLLTGLIGTAQTPSDLTGDWVFILQRQGSLFLVERGNLVHTDQTLSGKVGYAKVKGTVSGSSVKIDLYGESAESEDTLEGRMIDGKLSGTGTSPYVGLPFTWTAERQVAKPPQPTRHEFSPTEFQRVFSGATPPVLRVNDGDSIHTWSVDAGGIDASGVRRSLGGNPLTGPFYIEGAFPGDALVVTLTKVRTNRNWAQSGTGIIGSMLQSGYVARRKDAEGFEGRWKLDASAGYAVLEKNTPALKDFKVLLAPMLGCVAVAPPGLESIPTRDSGGFGGNMDFNRLREGTKVYLPVYQPGALLYVGDGHAAQGDGELTGDALETSMEIEVKVDVIRGMELNMPFIDDGESWMAMGIAGSLDQAIKVATTSMTRFLEEEHGLNSNEAAVVMGFAVKFDVADLVGTQVGIVARMPKAVLAQLPKSKHQW